MQVHAVGVARGAARALGRRDQDPGQSRAGCQHLHTSARVRRTRLGVVPVSILRPGMSRHSTAQSGIVSSAGAPVLAEQSNNGIERLVVWYSEQRLPQRPAA